MLYFFATTSGGEARTNIIDTIEDIDVAFKDITS